MKLHEFQAKQLFTSYRIPVPSGGVAESAEAAAGVASSLDASRW
ncbi:MAG: succinate--CoA ligase subunit beta, partial [Nitrospira sp.]|nr:succinate--CoA ligase subunit beta [Nitrospira sp.]